MQIYNTYCVPGPDFWDGKQSPSFCLKLLIAERESRLSITSNNNPGSRARGLKFSGGM